MRTFLALLVGLSVTSRRRPLLKTRNATRPSGSASRRRTRNFRAIIARHSKAIALRLTGRAWLKKASSRKRDQQRR